MTEDQIKHMVNRFLQWKLPEDFDPDCGISFEPRYNMGSPALIMGKHEPVGTNLFTADQAEAMVRYLVEMPTPLSIGWHPIATFPAGGTFPVAVWEGSWDQPRRNRRLRLGYKHDEKSSVRCGSYRTEEGEAFEITHWFNTGGLPPS